MLSPGDPLMQDLKRLLAPWSLSNYNGYFDDDSDLVGFYFVYLTQIRAI